MNDSTPRNRDSVWHAAGVPSLLLVTAAGFSGYAALLPVAPLWAVHGGANEAGSGLVNGLLLLTTVLTQGLVPRLLQRFGVSLVLSTGLVFLGIPSLLQLISDNLSLLLALAAIRGIGFGILTVCGSAALAHLVPPARHGAAIGAYGAAIAVPQVLLLPLGPWLVDELGFWSVFVLGALPVFGIGFTPGLARAWRRNEADTSQMHSVAESSSGAQHPAEERRIPRGLGGPMLLLLAVTLAGGALITFAPQMVDFAAVTTAGLALLTIATAISRWVAGGLADRYGSRRFLWPLVLLTIAGLSLAAFSIVDPHATRIPVFLLAMAVTGIAYGGLQSLTLLLCLQAVRREKYDTASAVWNIGFDAGTGLGSVLVGSIAASLSFSVALLVAAAASLMTLPLALVRGRRSH